MSKFEHYLLRAVLVVVLLALAIGALLSIFKVMVAGSYWDTAPFWQTGFVGVIVPLIIIWVVIRLIISIVRNK